MHRDPDPTLGTWFVGCGMCGGNFYVKNAGIVRDGTSCEQCVDWPDDDLDISDSLVSSELEWCGCGNPEDVDRMMLAYLASREGDDWPMPKPEDVSEDAVLLLSYIADDLGWTDHGGGVGGAWLTDGGKVALANLRAAAA